VRRERIGSLALRAYPASFRSERGEEMLGALLDAGEDSTGAFVRGFASLIIGGCRQRARENGQLGARRLIADACCQSAVLLSVLNLSGLSERHLEPPPTWAWILLAAVLVCALLGRDRVGGICGVVLAGGLMFHQLGAQGGPGIEIIGHPGRAWFLGPEIVPFVCFAVMTFTPRIRAHDPRKLLWLIPTAVLFLIPETLVAALFLICMPLLGIILAAVDPRFAIVSVLLWTDAVAVSALLNVGLGLMTLTALLLAALITVARVRAITREIRA
jgi:hypothetical protein